MRIQISSFFLLSASVLLSGCALTNDRQPVQDSALGEIHGTIIGGQQPVSGATVTVWAAGQSSYGTGATSLGTTTTDGSGAFTFTTSTTCPTSTTPVYITAAGGKPGGTTTNANIMLAASLGPCSSSHSESVLINEVTTVATAFALSHFFTATLGGAPTTDLFGGTPATTGVKNAGFIQANTYTVPMLVSLSTGMVNANTSEITIESAKIYSVANTLAACVNSTGETSTTETTTNCGKLFSYTLPPGATTRPLDTLQATVQMALYPYQNVTALYNLGTASPPFVGLSTAPNDWTIGVSYTSSSFGLGINGTTTSSSSTGIDIDTNGNIWFPTNTSTSHGLGEFNPSTATFSGPYATTLTHPQYVAIDRQGNVFGSDLAVAHIAGVVATTPAGTVTTYTTTGFTGPIAAGYSGVTNDSMVYTGGGTASALGTVLYQELNGAITSVYTYTAPPNAIASYAYDNTGVSPAVISLAVDAATSGSSTVCRYESYNPGNGNGTRSSTTTSPCYGGGITSTTAGNDGIVTASNNQLCIYGYGGASCFTSPVALSAPKGIVTDGDGFVWAANAGSGSVSTFGDHNSALTSADYYATSTVAYLHNSSNGNTMPAPYGLAIDGAGNIWVSNAGCISTTGAACTPSSFVLSELIGAAAPSITPLAAQNIPQTNGTRPTYVIAAPVNVDSDTVAAQHSSRSRR